MLERADAAPEFVGVEARPADPADLEGARVVATAAFPRVGAAATLRVAPDVLRGAAVRLPVVALRVGLAAPRVGFAVRLVEFAAPRAVFAVPRAVFAVPRVALDAARTSPGPVDLVTPPIVRLDDGAAPDAGVRPPASRSPFTTPSRVVTRPPSRAPVVVRPFEFPARASLALERVVPAVERVVVPAAVGPRAVERVAARAPSALPADRRSVAATPPIVRALLAAARRSTVDAERRLSLPRVT